jgi:exopolysaccharide biosynthesis polyprenyl glycosylphosphotransferase
MRNARLQSLKYMVGDLISSITAYLALYSYRKNYIEIHDGFSLEGTLSDSRFFLGVLVTPIFWIVLYYITGFYQDIFRRSRLKEIIQTFTTGLLGAVVIFFVLILDDWVASYKEYYQSFGLYFGVLFFNTTTIRFTLSSITNNRVQSRIITFPTLLIGSNENAAELYQELESQHKSTGNKFIGFVSVNNNVRFLLEKNLPHLGEYPNLPDIIRKHQIEEVIIAIETREHGQLEQIINLLQDTPVSILMIPDTYDILSGQVKLESLGSPLIRIKQAGMPVWQQAVKRLFDIFISLLVIFLLSPLLLFTAILVKLSSPGPIFFRQKRIGQHGRPFTIYKFRSMVEDAEKEGPQLSSKEDTRVTRWGRIMRKYRLDEFPQFFNVLIGDMSIVGPRPEREFYAKQILLKAPHYKRVYRVKPGITSWGMVKFGYAENVQEMVQRLRYDIIYLENMNLLNDIKILIYTILIVLQGRGK